jgi:predicted ATPase/class 3 adenylate cyclase/Tfp pilus assembly protein PilF
MASLPTGTVTFVFTDIEGSTRLLQQWGDRYVDALSQHNRLLRGAVEGHAGQVMDTQGDAIFAVFHRARDALAASVAAQRSLAAHPWPAGAAVRVRMGLHTGEPLAGEMGYVGMDVHLAARICAAGHGGQILMSQTTCALVADDLPAAITLKDLGKHRLKDLDRPQHLFQIVAAGLSADFPPLRSLDLHAHNLPIQMTRFIGRERELREVKALLAKGPLLTLAGAGGCGKTRLALQVAADLLEEFPDGVWLVELAALSDPKLVVQQAAAPFGVREFPDADLRRRLIDVLRSKQALLIFDNCEHVIDACADLAKALLQRCARLTILSTSREPLLIDGETIYRVPPLSRPDLEPLPSLESLLQYEAVRLFIERASASPPAFTLSNDNAPAVAQICRQLDGIPLAIELAAARVKTLSVEQIAQRLDERFQLLTSGLRTTLPHHQTLQSAMDWSYALLSHDEQVLFRRLSAFAGGFTLDAAEAVCAGEGIGAGAVLDLLTQLVLKSLVMTERGGAEVRYSLLETVRQYSRSLLEDAREAARVRRRHHGYFLEFAKRAEPLLHGPEQVAWLERLETEHDNLRAALEWCSRGKNGVGVLRLSSALWWFWYVRGYHREGRHWLERGLARHGGRPSRLRAEALRGAGFLATYQCDFAAARSLIEQSLDLYRQLGDAAGVADGLYGLGRIALRQGDLKRAEVLYEEALALLTRVGAKESIGALLNGLGVFATNQGDFAKARSLFEESLAINRAIGNMRGIAFSTANLGVLTFREGNPGAARLLVKESLAMDSALGDKRGIASELEELAAIDAMHASSERAARLLGAADALREVIGAPISLVERAFSTYDRCLDALAAALGHKLLTAKTAEGKAMGLKEALQYALEETPSFDA